MKLILFGFVFAGLLPLCLAWWAQRRTSLTHALAWTVLAWLSWAPAILFETDARELTPARYVALCLTGCAGIAVLGARRPHVRPWDFVVLVLLLVMLLPLAESQFIGTSQTEGLRLVFMLGTIAVGTLNYAPTRLGPAALFVLGACTGQLLFTLDMNIQHLLDALLLASPWLGWICWRMCEAQRGPFNRMWFDFRDSWGFVWSQRVREQFNASANNVGWTARLDWTGLNEKSLNAEDEEKHLIPLRAVLRRFLASDQNL